MDIAVNKLFTIYQKLRSRDFIDLYMINKHYGFTIDDLIKKRGLNLFGMLISCSLARNLCKLPKSKTARVW